MKRIITMILCVVLVMSMALPAAANGVNINIDGESVSFVAYNIEGNNYFRLRDLANALSGTNAQFDVIWNEAGKVEITTGVPYSGGRDAIANVQNPEIVSASTPVYCDGKRVSAKAYNIGGYNFFKLRDIAKEVDFGVSWSQTSGIGIDTGRGYALTAEEERALYIEYAKRRHSEFVTQNDGWWEEQNYYSFGDVDRDGKDELLVKKRSGITIYKAIDGEVQRMLCDMLPESTGEYQYHHVIYDGKDYVLYIKRNEYLLCILVDDALLQDGKAYDIGQIQYAHRYKLEELK